MSCQRCEELHQKFAIRSPGELSRAIRVVQANLADRTLEQAPRPALGASSTPFLTVSESGPWDDVLLYEFTCRSCGACFLLSAVWFLGLGGVWLPVVCCPVF